ncbi:cytochrome P450 [Schizopora paradoxa]|uniref:Cytochrome P450 n=1 Tax=Schizopora paradoxa TaxID=27342 RepID=A0A0H2R7A1_9AGAM|nr:cytochrome P450 [Schizopora paradoxa]KLO07695.1 cytochrome P450 [Schizopora paradoxa]
MTMSFRDLTDSKGYAICLAGVVISMLLVRYRKRSVSRLPLPPGPSRLPIIGNLLQMPTSHLWEKATEWRKQYGDVVYVENVGIPTLILNSYEAASELLDKRSAIYSSRPHVVMTNDLQGWTWATTMLPYGETLRKHRTYLHRFFQTSEALNYVELQERETYVMLNGLLDTPDKYEQHVRRLPGAVILRNVYGYEVQGLKDPMVELGYKVLRSSSESLEYLYLDFLPWLKYLPEWFPGIKFPRVGREGREIAENFRSTSVATGKAQYLASGKECMTSILLAENALEDGSFIDEDIIWDASSLAFLGGTDTSVTAIMTFILAMLKNPDKQRRAQEEIDAVIGPDRLPNLSDKDSLPYIQAICTETLRWEVVLPLALPHYLTDEDEYMGYRIPAGSMILANNWAISRDPALYPDPLSFKPERWIPGGTKEGVPNLRSEDFAFGFGRRICPGQNWAEHIIFQAVASILATFTIEKAVEPDGKPIAPNDNFHPSPVRTLGGSQCTISPRSEKAALLIRQAFATL